MKPYEKCKEFGVTALTDQELLAVIIRLGTANKDAMALAAEVLGLCGKEKGLLGLHHLEIRDFMQIDGIGEVKAVKLKCIAELSNRIARKRVMHGSTFEGPAQIAAYYMEAMRHLEKEEGRALFLDAKCNLLAEEIISIGSISSAVIPRRELFRGALKANAAQIVLLHNHPSGDPTPSREDIGVTAEILKASQLMEIPLVDHIIIGDNTYISLKERGLL